MKLQYNQVQITHSDSSQKNMLYIYIYEYFINGMEINNLKDTES